MSPSMSDSPTGPPGARSGRGCSVVARLAPITGVKPRPPNTPRAHSKVWLSIPEKTIGMGSGASGEPLKLHQVHPLDREAAERAAPGTFLGLEDGALAVAAGGGTTLGLLRVQRPGRRKLAAAEFLRGERLEAGAVEFSTPRVEA